MIATIAQPRLFPSCNFLHRMLVADVFIWEDTCQFSHSSEQHRCRIPHGRDWRWLTAPVRHPRAVPTGELLTDERTPWRRKAVETIRHTWGSHGPAFADVVDILSTAGPRLVDLTIASVQPALDRIAPHCGFELASDLFFERGDATTEIISQCQLVGADTYLSGPSGRHYLDLPRFAAAGIGVQFHRWPQPFPYLTYLETLFAGELTRQRLEGMASCSSDGCG